MKKTVQNVKNSLKFKAAPKAGILSVRVGVRKYVVPVESRLLSDGTFLFLSFPSVSELFRVGDKKLTAIGANEDASEALKALTPTAAKRRGRRRSTQPAVPAAVAAALREVPSGYKLGFHADGTPKLVKSRKRRAAKAAK